MTNRGCLLLLLLGAGLCHSVSPAAATPESRAAVIFLLIEPGARAIAMGESFVAVADDATATYFNPAALSGQGKRCLNFTHSKWLPALADDLSYEFLAYSQPVQGWGNLGFNIALLNLGEQTRTDERGNVQGTFSSYDVALSTAYGSQVSDRVSAGIGLKFIRSNLANVGAGIERGKGVGNSFAVDLGLLWQTTPRLQFGAALRNMGPRIAYIDASQADPLPQHLVVGGACKVVDTEYNDVLLTMDVYKPLISDGNFATNLAKAWTEDSFSETVRQMDLHAGGEYKYGLSTKQDQAYIALRAGYTMDRDGELSSPTFGVGVKYNLFQVDVAYLTANDTPMQDNTRFSLNLSF